MTPADDDSGCSDGSCDLDDSDGSDDVDESDDSDDVDNSDNPDDADVSCRRDASIPGEAEIVAEIEGISLTPTEHQRVKDLVNGSHLQRIGGYDRRYLVAGAGGETGAATRRQLVYDRLDARRDPPAVATRLEDFGLSPEEVRLWTRVFDILCGMATHVVGVIEDFDGGYVWELGLLFAPTYREKVWVLKRRYPDVATERARYDNGMAASHVRLLLTGDGCVEWTDVDELRDAVSEVP